MDQMNLPPDLLLIIVEFCDKPTQIQWSCTNRFFFLFTSKILWQELTIMYTDIVQWGDYRILLNGPRHIQDGGIMRMLCEGPFRKRTTRSSPGFPVFSPQAPKVPGDLVQHINLDVEAEDRAGRTLNNYSVTLALKTFAMLQALRSLRFNGALKTAVLLAINDLRGLVSLELRTRGLDMYWPNNYKYYEATVAADFAELEDLTGLKVLKVGQIRSFEGLGLASAIRKLNLTTLELTVSQFGRRDTKVSPFAFFFRRLVDPQFGPDGDLNEMTWPIGNHGHLPVTLRVLKLSDGHHSSLATRPEVFLAAFQRCERLEYLHFNLRDACLIGTLLGSLGLPKIRSLTVSGWKIDSEDHFAGLSNANDHQIASYSMMAHLDQRIEEVDEDSSIKAIESICNFMVLHQDSLQRFELLNAMSATDMLASRMNTRLEMTGLATRSGISFSARELRITTPPADYFTEVLGPAYEERMSYRIFGMASNRDRGRWGEEIQRIRVEDIEWSRFVVEGFDSYNLKKVRILDLRSRLKSWEESARTYQDPWWKAYVSAPKNNIRITAVGDIGTTVPGRIAWDILRLDFRSLRVIAVGSYRYWIEHNEDNRTIWNFEGAWEDGIQRSAIGATMNDQDWRFLDEPSAAKHLERWFRKHCDSSTGSDFNTEAYRHREQDQPCVDNRTNTLVFHKHT
ncbi:MAG: hypothetical protein Q9187_003918 [Circinaria calcarea]